MTLKQLSSAVHSNVVSGINGMDSLTFSIEQLQDEIILTSSAVVVKMVAQGLISAERLHQRIDGIRIACADLSANCDVPSNIAVPHFEIPNINRIAENPISYLGSVDAGLVFKVYFDHDWRFHKYRLATANKPFAWVSSTANGNGFYDVFLFNMGKYNNLKFITIEMLLDNPYDLLKSDYFEQFNASEFYAPLAVQQEVIDILTKKYLSYFRQLYKAQTPNIQQA